MATTLPDTAIAAANSGANINVYFQQTDGSIIEHSWRERKGAWSWKASTKLAVAAGGAKIFTSLAAGVVYPPDDDDATEWHVFYVNNSNQLCEVYYSSGSWTTGTLNAKKITTAPFSRIALFSDTLYYQRTSGQIWSVTRGSNGWTENTNPMTSKVPLLGTSLAAIKDAVINQGSTCAVESNDGASVTTTDVKAASPHSSLAAVGDGDSQNIFYTSNTSRLKQQFSKKSTGESKMGEVANITPRSDIAAIRDKPSDEDPDVLHVFFQKDGGDKVCEFKYIDGQGWMDKGTI